MSDSTLPSFRYRLEQQPSRTGSGGVVRGHLSDSSLSARASPAPLCACNRVPCANSIGTRPLPNWVTSCLAVAAPPY
jgi:hypothetical protein